MLESDYWIYDEKEEEKNGAYWQFANATIEEIKKANLYYYYIFRIIVKIKDKNLKQKMCEKMYDYAENVGISTLNDELIEQVFSRQQITDLTKSEIDDLSTKIENQESNEITKIDNWTESSISQLITQALNLKEDDEVKYHQLNSIFHTINKKNYENLENVNAKLIYNIYRRNPNIAKKFVQEYNSKISPHFLKFIEVSEDTEYLQKKSEKFRKDNIKIGVDPRISFGLEVEADHDIGFKFNVTNQRGYEKYTETIEATVPRGTEIVCPPIHDTPEELSKICALLDTMKEEGFYYDEEQENAAGQINMGLNYLDTAKAVKNFYEIFGNCEELLFHISNVEGQLTRQDIYLNSRFKPISEIIGTRVLDEDISREELLQKLYVSKRPEKQHIEGLQYKKNTVGIRDLENPKTARLEIKIPNGSTEYQVWIDNMRLYGKIVEMSRKLAEIENKEEITEHEENLLWLKENLANPKSTLEDKLYDLMDLLFEDDEIKEIYVNRFYALQQKIEETGTKKYDYSEKKRIYGEKAFGRVDFQEQYQSRRQRGVVTFDPETGIYNENGKEERI